MGERERCGSLFVLFHALLQTPRGLPAARPEEARDEVMFSELGWAAIA